MVVGIVGLGGLSGSCSMVWWSWLVPGNLWPFRLVSVISMVRVLVRCSVFRGQWSVGPLVSLVCGAWSVVGGFHGRWFVIGVFGRHRVSSLSLYLGSSFICGSSPHSSPRARIATIWLDVCGQWYFVRVSDSSLCWYSQVHRLGSSWFNFLVFLL